MIKKILRVTRWHDAALRYRNAIAGGWHENDRDPMRDKKEVVDGLDRLLGAFFDARNPEWTAAKQLLSYSNKAVELKKREKGDFVIRYLLDHEGFWSTFDLVYPFEMERHPKDRQPLMRRKMLLYDVARLLVDAWDFQCGTPEQMFERLIEKINEVSRYAPDAEPFKLGDDDY